MLEGNSFESISITTFTDVLGFQETLEIEEALDYSARSHTEFIFVSLVPMAARMMGE